MLARVTDYLYYFPPFGADLKAEMQSAIPLDWRPYLRSGETRRVIERNAAAAGFAGYFHAEFKYLKWRAEQEVDQQAG